MKAAILFILFIIPIIINSQNTKTIGAIKSIGPYELDDNGNVTFVRIIELDSMSADEIFNRAEEYFTYHYGSGESVLQVNDRQSGRLIGKGFYKETVYSIGLVTVKTDTWHILRVDVKDGKARLTLSLTEYAVKADAGSSGGPSYYNDVISEQYPVNKEGRWKNVFGQAFAESYKRSMRTLDELGKTLHEGTTFKGADQDW